MKEEAMSATLTETISWKGKLRWVRAKISLFRSDGQWGYCLSVSARKNGFAYGPYLKFCTLHPTRQDALSAAVAEIVSRVEDKDLIKQKQLNLF